MFNFVEDTRALKFVRQFHTKRIQRFLRGRQFREVEDKTDLARSKKMVEALNTKLNK